MFDYVVCCYVLGFIVRRGGSTPTGTLSYRLTTTNDFLMNLLKDRRVYLSRCSCSLSMCFDTFLFLLLWLCFLIIIGEGMCPGVAEINEPPDLLFLPYINYCILFENNSIIDVGGNDKKI